jgi:hypothetical protein
MVDERIVLNGLGTAGLSESEDAGRNSRPWS